jgi:hypothetical protein
MCVISGSICKNDVGITNYETSAGRNTSGGFVLLLPTSTQLQKIHRNVHTRTLWLSVVDVFSGFSGTVLLLVLASKTQRYRVSCTSVVKGGNVVLLSLTHKRREVIFANFILGFTSYFTENTILASFCTSRRTQCLFLIPIINACRSPLF